MADDKAIEGLQEDQEDFNRRLREIEISHSSLSSTIVNMNSNITEMKGMFQKFMLDSERITEIAGKIEAVNRLENEINVTRVKTEEFSQRLMMLEYSCKTCNINKVNDYIKDMSDKVSKIETSLDELKSTKIKFNGFWGNIGQSLLVVIILYMLYMVAIHIQPTDNPLINAPTMKDKSGSIELVTNAAAASFKIHTSQGILKRDK